MSEITTNKPPFLNRLFRCSACAKKLLYGIIIFVGVTSFITISVFEPYEVDINVLSFLLLAGLTIALYGFLIYGSIKLFKAYCDKESGWYDDGMLIFFGLIASFIIFLLTLAIVHDAITQDTSFFAFLWERAFN